MIKVITRWVDTERFSKDMNDPDTELGNLEPEPTFGRERNWAAESGDDLNEVTRARVRIVSCPTFLRVDLHQVVRSKGRRP